MDPSGLDAASQLASTYFRKTDRRIEPEYVDLVRTYRTKGASRIGLSGADNYNLMLLRRDQKALSSFSHLSYNRRENPRFHWLPVLSPTTFLES